MCKNIIKKISKIIFLVIPLLIIGSGYHFTANAKTVNLNEITPRAEDLTKPELSAVGDLPNVTINAIFTTVIKTILAASMILTIMAIVMMAFYYITAQGDDEETGKAKKIILYLLIGVAIMAGAYGIILGLAKFNFFN